MDEVLQEFPLPWEEFKFGDLEFYLLQRVHNIGRFVMISFHVRSCGKLTVRYIIGIVKSYSNGHVT